jgi:murein DD-endopeptidase MepM/ murein hydrolase activator NlpD
MSDEKRHDDESQTAEKSPAQQSPAQQSPAEQSPAEQSPSRKTSRAPEADEGWELWAKVALLMGAIGFVAWTVVLLRLGEPSVYAYAFIVPALGALSVPVVFWGLIKTVFNRPIFRRSRTIGFGLLLAVGFFGNSPMFAVPLSTEDFESTHSYRLPFDGEWAVTAGGDSTTTNYHATTPTYRYAYDFTPVVDGERHKDDGKALTDYYCYGKPVLTPTAGEVVRVQDKYKDNNPAKFDARIDAQSVMGNHVVIEVDDSEYLFVAHMKEGSVAVERGDEVSQGQKIGECGNSGGSVKPNVHVHLQNSKEFPVSESLPLEFSDYVSDGEPVEKGMPQGSTNTEEPFGERVKNAKGD